jgi:RsiW-degrading membrane proteinase PrsW (M82 family)
VTDVSAARPRKWLGAWGGLWIALASIALIGLELLVAWLLRDVQRPSPRPYQVIDPVFLLIGSGCLSAAFLYTMAYRLNPAWRLSVARVVGGGLLAGFLAAVAAGLVNGAIDAFGGGTVARPATVGLTVVGLVEESAKLGAVLVLARGLPVKSPRVGLFLGGAVGFGFAAVENLGYLETAWSVGLTHHGALSSTLITAVSRQLLGPFLHPVLTGLLAAAVFLRSRLAAVGVFVAVAAAHSLFDLGASASNRVSDPYTGAAVTALTIVAYVIAAFLAWFFVARALKKRDTRPPTPASSVA